MRIFYISLTIALGTPDHGGRTNATVVRQLWLPQALRSLARLKVIQQASLPEFDE